MLFFWEFGPHQLEVEFLAPDKAEFLHLDRDTHEAVTGTLTFGPQRSRPAFAFNAIPFGNAESLREGSMTGDEPIGDDEIILRHIPGGTTFQAPGLA